jgi:hypothetical protein
MGEIRVTAKPTRMSREELRQLLLDTGTTMLREEGLSSGVEALTFKRVFERIEHDTGVRLTNASVIRRVWDNLADYRTDVLIAVAGNGSDEDIEAARRLAAPLMQRLDVTTPEARDASLREICRVGGALNARAVHHSQQWPLSIGVWALAASGPPSEQRKRIEVALLASHDVFTDRIESLYGGMAAFLGLRLRERFTLRDFIIAEDSLSEGYGLRDRLDGGAAKVVLRPTGPNGEEQEWTIFAVGLEALIRQFFELDPGWVPPGRRGREPDRRPDH